MPLLDLLDKTTTPMYLVSAAGEIVYGNQALCDWVGLPREDLIARRVEYHSEPATGGAAPLTGLCPPPTAFEQDAVQATLSTQDRAGKLRHRRAQFLALADQQSADPPTLLGVLDPQDLAPRDLELLLNPDQMHDALHRDIRRFRREHTEPAATALTLGDSPQAHLLRSQFELAAQTHQGALLVSDSVEDAALLARAIHYARQDASAELVVLDCEKLDLGDAAHLLSRAAGAAAASVLAHQPVAFAPDAQAKLADLLVAGPTRPLVMMTTTTGALHKLAPGLRRLAGPVRIDLPTLAQRVRDLPMISQYLLERLNPGADRQVEGFQPEALDKLSLYDWPSGVEQLAAVIEQARSACEGTLVGPADLPPLVQHAATAAGLEPRDHLPIELDTFLQSIERELVVRALDRTQQNKAEAARLLGLSRQRLYRRMEGLGLMPPDTQQESQDE